MDRPWVSMDVHLRYRRTGPNGRRRARWSGGGAIVATREELRTLNGEFADALEQRDADRLAELYVDDAVFLVQGSPTVTGRAAIREMMASLPASTKRTSFETVEVYEDGDLVVDVGTLLSDGTRVGSYVVVYRRQADGTLKMAVDVPISDH